MAEKIRIFVSSPGDVGQERLISTQVIERLKGEFSRYMDIDPYLWERQPLVATDHFQTQIARSSESDIVIFILWSRLGTKLPESIQRPDGSTYNSGTEFEFEHAIEAFKAKGIPQLLVYRKQIEPNLYSSEEAVMLEKLEQKKALEAFLNKWFGSTASGFKAAFHVFNTPNEFESLLEEHLRKLITEKIPENPVSLPVKRWYSDPFRGLEAFDFEHSPVFFGRTKAVGEVKDKLLDQAYKGKPFVIIYGMSGCGKSSLARAGVIPTITHPGVIEGVGMWLWAAIKPGDTPGNLFAGLVSSLSKDGVLPGLANDEKDFVLLVKQLRENPGAAVEHICRALTREAIEYKEANRLEKIPEPRLVLLIDQLEELFTFNVIGQQQREEFFRAVSAMVGSGKLWVLATMRSDFYHRCAEIPQLAKLTEGGEYRLLKPDLTEIGQMIRNPAIASGLSFEVNPGTRTSLDEMLYEAAGRDTASLPLLQFTLEELFKQRVIKENKEEILTIKAYNEMGGLEGALAQRAEAVFSALVPEARSAFSAVFRSLITINPNGDSLFASSRVPFELLAASEKQKILVEAFINARLLVSDRDNDGRAVVRLAHEALLNCWPRLKRLLEDDRDYLRIRERAAAAAYRWRNEGRKPDFLLQKGKPLAEAEELLKKYNLELAPDIAEYIQASKNKAVKAGRLKLGAAAAAFLVVLVFAFSTFIQLQEVNRQKQKAYQAQSELQSDVSVNESQNGNSLKGLTMALEALDNIQQPEKALKAQYALRYGLYSRFTQGAALLKGHRENVTSVDISPDGKLIVTGSMDGSARVWDGTTGSELLVFDKQKALIDFAVFLDNGSKVATASWDKTVQIWDTKTGNILKSLTGHTDKINFMDVSTDGRLILTGSDDATARLWEASSGKQLFQLDCRGKVAVARLSPDGRFIFTGSRDGEAAVWNGATGEKLYSYDITRNLPVDLAEFSPDGSRLLFSSWANTAILLDVPGAAIINEISYQQNLQNDMEKQGITAVYIYDPRTMEQTKLEGENLYTMAGKITCLKFSPDGTKAIITLRDKTARIVDTASGSELFKLEGFEQEVTCGTFSPDSKFVATGSLDNTIKIWNADNGGIVKSYKKHTDNVNNVIFSKDGSRLISTSWDDTARLWLPGSDEDYVEMPVDSYKGSLSDNCNFPATRRSRESEKGDSINSEIIKRLNFGNGAVIEIYADKTATLLDKEGGTEIFRFHDFQEDIMYYCFNPDGTTLATCNMDGSARLWDVESGKLIKLLDKHKINSNKNGGGVIGAAFSPDGKLFATASTDGTARIWDAGTGEQKVILDKHKGEVHQVEFSRDSRLIMTSSSDGTARLWDSSNGNELACIDTQGREIVHIGFGDNEDYIIIILQDGSLIRSKIYQDARTLIRHASEILGVKGK